MDTNYGKIEDTVMFMGVNAILKMNVVLTDANAERVRDLSFHTETEYYSKAANKRLVTLHRAIKAFLTIENLKANSDGKRAYIMVTSNDILSLRSLLKKFYKIWKDPDLYAKDGPNVHLQKHYDPFILEGLPMGMYLVFQPDVATNKDGNTYPAVRVSLGDDNNFVTMSSKTFDAFVYFILNADIYEYAQNMLSYFGRPQDGTNRFVVQYNNR